MGLRAAAPPPFHHPLPHPIDLSDLHLIVPKFGSSANGGGRGGDKLIDPHQGNPRFERAPIVTAQVPLLANPQLAITSSIAVPPDIKLPDDPSLPNIGVHNSTNITLTPSNPGGRNGYGTGPFSGDGPGGGNDHGPGYHGGIGTPGVGGVSYPVPVLTPEAEFSDEARRQKYQGACLVTIIVDSHGNPQNPRVVRALGMGLDEKALDAVRRYRFKPAMKDGKPVPVMITVEVNFRLY
jgi:TonB family protein